MSKKKLIKKLIKHYKRVIKKVKKADDLTDAKSIIRRYYVEAGICKCADVVFKVDIYRKNWVEKRTIACKAGNDSEANWLPNAQYWNTPPRDGNTILETICFLKARIKMMKKI
jgi:hypothetical protein